MREETYIQPNFLLYLFLLYLFHGSGAVLAASRSVRHPWKLRSPPSRIEKEANKKSSAHSDLFVHVLPRGRLSLFVFVCLWGSILRFGIWLLSLFVYLFYFYARFTRQACIGGKTDRQTIRPQTHLDRAAKREGGRKVRVN